MLLFPLIQISIGLSPLILALTLASASSTAIVVTSTSITTNISISPTVLASSTTLRILPLGDSNTYGVLSPSLNGYRLYLSKLLTSAGNPVSFAGSVRSGTMYDNYNEGHSGATISQIASYAPYSLPNNPNIVLLLAGTNDCTKRTAPASAPCRLRNLIEDVVFAVANTTILVALLPPIANDADAQANVLSFNAAVPDILTRFVQRGDKVLGVNMSSFLTIDDLADGVHPTDMGYEKMAGAWYEGLKVADRMGWIVEAGEKEEGFVNVSTSGAPDDRDKENLARIQGSVRWVGLLAVGLLVIAILWRRSIVQMCL